jgi:GNAT superfamily N-acetyltransferase
VNAALLDNLFWHALSGPQRHCSTGTVRARRYAPGFSPILASPQARAPDFEALRPYCQLGERLYSDGWSGPVPTGWQLLDEGVMLKMIADVSPEAEADEAVPLGLQHAAQACALAELTHPGPFGPRTLELGDYFGVFLGERLIAMAGERACAGVLREISGVCTHPEFQGRGLARQLMRVLMRRQRRRGEIPVLHVVGGNIAARALYEALGFRVHAESVVRVVFRSEA